MPLLWPRALLLLTTAAAAVLATDLSVTPLAAPNQFSGSKCVWDGRCREGRDEA